MDEVNFDDVAPWPTGPDGDGPALARVSTAVYGQQPSNWIGASATPGSTTATPQPTTIAGTSEDDSFHVVRSGAQLHVYVNAQPVTDPPTHTFALAALDGALIIDALAGDDSLFVDSGQQGTLDIERIVYQAGAGANRLVLADGSAWIDSTTDVGGTLDTTVRTSAHLSTSRLKQNGLTLEPNSEATLLPDGGTNALTSLTLGDDATLDITNNALVLDYSGDSPLAEIRERIRSGRGGLGLGTTTWDGPGITSSAAAQANSIDAESRSVGYAENAALPLGPYTTFRGQPVDDTAILIAYTSTADANLDGLVNDDDVTILGATYAPGVANPHWAFGDADYNGVIDDDDVTLLGAFYIPPIAPPPPPSDALGGNVDSSRSTQKGSSLDAAAVDCLLSLQDESIATSKTRRIRVFN